MSTARTLAAVTCAALLSAFPAAAAAAPPANDLFAGATAVTLPYEATIDTTEATTDADDTAAKGDCVDVEATEASVWFDVTATQTGRLEVDLTGTDYPVGMIVVTGAPGSFQRVACAPFETSFQAVAGETYHLLVFDTSAGGSNGGTLRISIVTPPPPPAVDITVSDRGRLNGRTGGVTLSGTITCTDATFSGIRATLTQSVGPTSVFGTGSTVTGAICDGTARPWTLEVTGGRFTGGLATASLGAMACPPQPEPACAGDFETVTVRLSGRPI
jgi:hypothetical protein